MSEQLSFPVHQALSLKLLIEKGQEIEIGAVAELLDAPYPQIAGALQSLAKRGLVTLREEVCEEFMLGSKGKALEDGVLPERRVMEALVAKGGRIHMRDLAQTAGLPQKEAGKAIKPLDRMGAATRDGGYLVAVGRLSEGIVPEPGEHEKLLKHLHTHGSGTVDTLSQAGINAEEAMAALSGRSGIVVIKERRRWSVSLTEKGESLRSDDIVARETVNILDRELLKDGAWRTVDFRPYDVQLASKRLVPGKKHPFRRILEDTKRAFLDMGFTEVTSPHVESAFWGFDALFQPQDHPAREMQDTFYVKRPAVARLPDGEIVERVRQTHECGWETGSRGWGSTWSKDKAREIVLRTHTTAGTIRALAANPNPPQKIFIVGTVFRRETVDYKHLPLFHQVDGIVVDEQGSFSSLLGTLDQFYRKMGFSKFEFRPAFFPYTEPSVEVFVWHEEKKDWVEMGGAGVFRDEVTKPVGCDVPVLAWGLGLERLAMFRYGLASIRDIYHSDIEWLREVPLCR